MSSIQVRVIRVSLDGSGDYDKVQEAVDSVSLSNTMRTVIQVSPGFYKGPVYVPKTKNLITLVGCDPERTIISWHNTATCINHHQVCKYQPSLYHLVVLSCLHPSIWLFYLFFFALIDESIRQPV